MFQLTGSLVSNFSESQQKAFSNQLRALLTQFDFMSIAVNGFTVRWFCQAPSFNLSTYFLFAIYDYSELPETGMGVSLNESGAHCQSSRRLAY